MHCIKKRQVSLKKSKEKNKKIGTRSIHDIIYNTAELTFKQKVDYIRHHYVYYQGNYEYFHTQNGSPNAKKFKLNKLIAQIIKGEKNASELKEINSQILQWRKERNDELERLNRKSLDSIPLPDIPDWHRQGRCWISARGPLPSEYRPLPWDARPRRCIPWTAPRGMPWRFRRSVQAIRCLK